MQWYNHLRMREPITVQATVNAPIEKVWEYWNKPEHITGWAFASNDWEAPAAENDLRVGGMFKTTMAAKDPSTGSGQVRESFDVIGTYTNVIPQKTIEYNLEDNRRVVVKFEQMENQTKITETFEPYPEYSDDIERGGWQAILDNFKKYVEGN